MSIRIEEECHPSGSLCSRSYYYNGKPHRSDGGPAVEIFYENGRLESRQYYKDGKLHRLDGPAEERFYENGSIELFDTPHA